MSQELQAWIKYQTGMFGESSEVSPARGHGRFWEVKFFYMILLPFLHDKGGQALEGAAQGGVGVPMPSP